MAKVKYNWNDMYAYDNNIPQTAPLANNNNGYAVNNEYLWNYKASLPSPMDYSKTGGYSIPSESLAKNDIWASATPYTGAVEMPAMSNISNISTPSTVSKPLTAFDVGTKYYNPNDFLKSTQYKNYQAWADQNADSFADGGMDASNAYDAAQADFLANGTAKDTPSWFSANGGNLGATLGGVGSLLGAFGAWKGAKAQQKYYESSLAESKRQFDEQMKIKADARNAIGKAFA